MSNIATTRLTYSDGVQITAWYRMHSINKTNLAGPAGQHHIKEPPKVPPRQAHCSCGAILIVEDEKDCDDESTFM